MSWADFITGFFTVLQILVGAFLIFIILLQRGKGGGLVGALGGMGGASALGPKADIHVLKLTIGLAIAWVVIACTGIYLNRSYKRGIGENDTPIKKVEKDTTEGETKDGEGPGDKTLNTEGSETKASEKAGTDKKAETKSAVESKTAPAGEDGASVKPSTGEEKVPEAKSTEVKTTEKKVVEEKATEDKK